METPGAKEFSAAASLAWERYAHGLGVFPGQRYSARLLCVVSSAWARQRSELRRAVPPFVAG
jgi:hypothetical protein